MGCLFGKQGSQRNKYEMANDQDLLLQTLQIASSTKLDNFNYQEFSRVITLNGIWNELFFQEIAQDNKLQWDAFSDFLIKFKENPYQFLYKIFQSRSLECLLINLPKELFLRQVSKDETFLKMENLDQNDLWNNLYTVFENEKEEEQQEPLHDDEDEQFNRNKIEKKNTFLQDMQGIKVQDRENMANEADSLSLSLNEVKPKLNHSLIVKKYAALNKNKLISLDDFTDWFRAKKLLVDYFLNQLHIDTSSDIKSYFVWKMNHDNSFSKREIVIKDNVVLIKGVETGKVFNIVPRYNLEVECIPSIKYPNITKVGIIFHPLDDEYFFDTLDERQSLVNNYTHKAIGTNYQIGKEITKGVYQCTNPLKISTFSLNRLNADYYHGARIQKSISFKGVHQIVEYFSFNDQLDVICERVQMDLQQYLEQYKNVEEFNMQRVFKQFLFTLSYLHSMELVLGAICTEDITLVLEEKLRVINYIQVNHLRFAQYEPCSAVRLPQNYKVYAAPEVQEKGYDKKADSYLAGRLLQVLCGQEQVSESLQDLINQLCQASAQKRVSVEQALEHKWWNDASVEKKAFQNKNVLDEIL